MAHLAAPGSLPCWSTCTYGCGIHPPEQADRLAAISAVADADPEPFPQWPADRAAARSVWLMVHLQYGRAELDGRSALTEIDGLAAVVAGRELQATMVAAARVLAQHMTAVQGGDIARYVTVLSDIDAMRARMPQDSRTAERLSLVELLQRCVALVARADLGGCRRCSRS